MMVGHSPTRAITTTMMMVTKAMATMMETLLMDEKNIPNNIH
jgi:hypothetical protein